jgi:hypothetical protein
MYFEETLFQFMVFEASQVERAVLNFKTNQMACNTRSRCLCTVIVVKESSEDAVHLLTHHSSSSGTGTIQQL